MRNKEDSSQRQDHSTKCLPKKVGENFSNLMAQLKAQNQKEEIKHKKFRHQEIIKIVAKINTTNKKNQKMSMKQYFEKI